MSSQGGKHDYSLPATSASGEDAESNLVPSAVPEPVSITIPLYRSPSTSTPEDDSGDFVPSIAPEPSSISMPLCRLPATSLSAEDGEFLLSTTPVTVPLPVGGEGFVPAAAPEPSVIRVPLIRLPATSLDDGFVPSATPEPSSISVPLDRLPAAPTSAEDDGFVPSALPEPSTIRVPLIRLPTTTSAENVPLAAPEPSSITVPLSRLPPPSTLLEGGELVPSQAAVPEPPSDSTPLLLDRVRESTLADDDKERASSTSIARGEAKSELEGIEKTSSGFHLLPPTRLSPVERQVYNKLKQVIPFATYHDYAEGPLALRCHDGTRKNEIETIMKWIEVETVKNRLFVVQGPTGSGKTSLLNTTVQKCKAQGYCAAGFFFWATDPSRNTSRYLVATIAYQIAESIPELRPYVSRIIESEPRIFKQPLELQTQRLLLGPVRQLRADYSNFSIRPLVIIIDGLDECGKSDDQIRVITALTDLLRYERLPFLCLLSSRLDINELSTTLVAHIHDQVILGKDVESERADIRKYLRDNIGHIWDKQPSGTCLSWWLAEKPDLETLVNRSNGQFIYAATVTRYIRSSEHNPYERLQMIFDIPASKSEAGPFAEIDTFYRSLMSSVGNLAAAIEILGIHLVHSTSHFWAPRTVDVTQHFRLLDADSVLAPLTTLLRCEHNMVEIYHSSFVEFLLDFNRSHEYFVHPMKGQAWIVSQMVSHFYNHEWIEPKDVEYLIEEVKTGTELDKIVNENLTLATKHPELRPSGETNFNIWPFVSHAIFTQLQFRIPIDKIGTIFAQRGENYLPLSILMKLAPATNLSNTFLLFELCRTCTALQKARFLVRDPFRDPSSTSSDGLLLFMTYLSDYLNDQHRLGHNVLLPDDYLSASLRCLWYLQVPSRHVRSPLEFGWPGHLPQTFGISKYLKDASSNLTRGALDALFILLPHAPPSANLLGALKLPFDKEVLSRTPSSSRDVMRRIHDYLMQHDFEYRQDDHTSPEAQTGLGEDEPLPYFEVFLHQKGSEIPYWIEDYGSEPL